MYSAEGVFSHPLSEAIAESTVARFPLLCRLGPLPTRNAATREPAAETVSVSRALVHSAARGVPLGQLAQLPPSSHGETGVPVASHFEPNPSLSLLAASRYFAPSVSEISCAGNGDHDPV